MMFRLVEEIARVDEIEIESIFKAVLRRYAELFPEWELNVIPLQKSTDRNEQLDRVIQLIQNMKTIS